MKKLYAIQRASYLKVSRFSCVRVFSLAMSVLLLSNISSVFASNLAITAAVNLSQNLPAVNYKFGSHGSVVLSGDDDYCGADHVIGREASIPRRAAAITAEEEYRRFLEQPTFNGYSPYSQSDRQQIWDKEGRTTGDIGYMGIYATKGDQDIMPEAFGVYSFATGCGSAAQGSYSTAFGANAVARTGGSQAFGVAALAAGRVSVAIGVSSEATGDSAIALGGLSKANGIRSVAIGTRARAVGADSIAIGSSAEDNVNITLASGDKALAIGPNAQALVSGGVAIGADSVSNISAGVKGYSPLGEQKLGIDNFVWKSKQGAFSVGNIDAGITRQIVGVAAGLQDTDAVNVAQLKDLEVFVRRHAWRVSFDKDDPIIFSYDSEMNFSAGSNNFNVTRGDQENEIKFDLARKITLDSIIAGNNVFDSTGLKIKGGPQITNFGIDVRSKKITNIADGTDVTDAVNFGQLDKVKEEVQEQIAANSFIKQDSKTKYITIGKETVGDKIDITSQNGSSRTISGIKAGIVDTDAVNFAQLKAVEEAAAAAVKGLKINTTNEFFHDPSAVGEDSVAIGNGANANFSGGIAIGVDATIVRENNPKGDPLNAIAIGVGAKVIGVYSIAIGHNAFASAGDSFAFGTGSKAKADGAFAMGRGAEASSMWSFALGASAKVTENARNSVAIGWLAKADSMWSFALGAKTEATVMNGVAIGAGSVVDVAAGVAGYDPRTRGDAKNSDIMWKATLGALSVGAVKKDKTRQIIGVAAGTSDTDAVNVAQLKALQDSIITSWDLSVNGANATSVTSTSPMDLAVGSSNLNITKGEYDNKVKFDLAKDLMLNSIKLGRKSLSDDEEALSYAEAGLVTLDETGLIIKDGPQVTIAGINAGSKKITGVAEGTEKTDAVNFLQLKTVEKDIKEQVAANSFVKQNAETQHITIGKEVGGDKMDIANNKNEKRTLTGIKAGTLSEASNEAVIGSQLFTTNNKVDALSNNLQTVTTNIAQSFGGGAEYKDGKWIAPTFKVGTVNTDGEEKEHIYHNVAEALSEVGNSVTNVKNKITKEVNNIVTTVRSDSLLWNANDQVFSAQHGNDGNKTNSKITHLLDGDITSGSTDAVTGNQLNFLGNKVASYFGGNAKYENGTWVDPIFKIKRVKIDGTEDEQSYTSVAAAFEGVGAAFTNIKSEITNQINNAITNVQGDSLVKKDATTNHITIGKEVAGDEINIANNTNEARILSGVKDAVKANEAVNKGQLDKSIENANNEITNKFEKFTEKITKVTQEIQSDALLWSQSDNAFSAQHGKDDEKINSKITHLKAGDISVDSHDAINGSQLYTLGRSFARSLGGDGSYEEGQWVSPTFTVKSFKEEGAVTDTAYDNVASAFAGVGDSFEKVTIHFANIKAEISKEIDTVQSSALMWDKSKGAFVAEHEQEGNKTNSKLTSLADGDISATSTEAVNGSQLYLMNTTLASYFGGGAGYENGQWIAP
ncbi:autotransporter adhesin, partial [Bartonella fuyuanensis]|nr:autotransporter adhesin [Bartonella fuyuanensis]